MQVVQSSVPRDEFLFLLLLPALLIMESMHINMVQNVVVSIANEPKTGIYHFT